MEHWQFNSRSATVNFKKESVEDFQEINDKLATFQQKSGQSLDSFKDVFLALLEAANGSTNSVVTTDSEKTEPTTPTEQEFSIAITKDENEFLQLGKRLSEIHKLHGSSEKTTMGEAVKLAVEIAELPPQNSEEIVKEIEVVKEIPMEIGENQYLITLVDDGAKTIQKKKTLLSIVSNNRVRKSKTPQLETPEQTIEKLAFSGGALFNSEGDFYTGIS